MASVSDSFVKVSVGSHNVVFEDSDGTSRHHDPHAAVAQHIEQMRRRRRKQYVQRHTGAEQADDTRNDHHCEQLSLRDAIIPAQFPCSNSDPTKNLERMRAIAREFNKTVAKPVITNASARRGIRVEPGWYLVAHRNRRTEVAVGEGKRMVLRIQTGYTEGKLVGGGLFHHTEPIIGKYGKYIVNVPQGYYAKAWSGHHAILLGDGTHVVLDPLFRLGDESDAEDDAADDLAGVLATAEAAAAAADDDSGDDSERPAAQPSQRISPWLVSQSDDVIEHEELHIVRVAKGKIAFVTVNSQPRLLEYRDQPYVFETPAFHFAHFADASEPYSSCGSLHRLVVPSGTLAKVWFGSAARLLEAKEDPYIINDDAFRIDKSDASRGSYLVEATSGVIRHGDLVRIRPGVGGNPEVAVIAGPDQELRFSDGLTTIREPDTFVGFLDTGIQSFMYPTESATRLLLGLRPKVGLIATAADLVLVTPRHGTLFLARTCDSLRVGLKLNVAYQVSDATKLLSTFSLRDVGSHVERLALSDVSRIVQLSTAINYVSRISEVGREQLRRHLEACGITLLRFSVERAVIVDEWLERDMGREAKMSSELATEHALVQQRIALSRASLDRDTAERLTLVQCNIDNFVSAARAQLEASRFEAEIIVKRAEADAAVMESLGQLYRKYPAVLQEHLAAVYADAVKDWGVTFAAAGEPVGDSNGNAAARIGAAIKAEILGAFPVEPVKLSLDEEAPITRLWGPDSSDEDRNADVATDDQRGLTIDQHSLQQLLKVFDMASFPPQPC